MEKNYDAPDYIEVKEMSEEMRDQAISQIKRLCQEQSFGVLATQGQDLCYNSLISFAVRDDFKEIVFASPVDTKKIDYIKRNKNVSILIDNRDTNPESINDILAVTVMGEAEILDEDSKKYKLALKEKHAYLEDFIDAETSAIVRIKVSSYYYVSRFQEVVEWLPDKD